MANKFDFEGYNDNSYNALERALLRLKGQKPGGSGFDLGLQPTNSEEVKQKNILTRILNTGLNNSIINDPNQPPNTSLQDPPTLHMIKPGSKYNPIFTYEDKDGNTVTRKWTISDEEFQDHNALTQDQITKILNGKNPELVNRGIDKAIYEYSQKMKINPKVLLATLGHEQSWCIDADEATYKKAFGVGPGGNPGYFSDGGIDFAAKTYATDFNEGREHKGNIPEMVVNQDLDGAEARVVPGWVAANNPKYVEYMNKGITIKPVNAAMYAKLKYSPWLDFPPQGSQPLMDWHDIFRSL